MHDVEVAPSATARSTFGPRVQQRPGDDPDALVGRRDHRSALERALRRLVGCAGLPMPVFNRPLGRFTPDALWPAERVVVEVDGWSAHGHRRAFERDRARDAELQAHGYAVLRFTWRQVRDEPVLVASRMAQVLARR